MKTFSPTIQAVLEEFTPICRRLAGEQRYAISVSGSLGKGTWDQRSDIDFRLFTDQAIPWPWQDAGRWSEWHAAVARWKERGVNVDDIWPRPVADIDAALDSWLGGEIKPMPVVWTIWGYHILPDIYSQYVVEDPYQLIAGWKARLSVYPPALKQAILKKYAGSLRYWRGDYHYANKVERADPIFLAGMASKLVHEILQILFALNETYFVGDGSNLAFTEAFTILPSNFSARVQAILYPCAALPEAARSQYAALLALIDEVLTLVEA